MGLYTGLAGSLALIAQLGGGRDDHLVARLGEPGAARLAWRLPEYDHEPINDLLSELRGSC